MHRHVAKESGRQLAGLSAVIVVIVVSAGCERPATDSTAGQTSRVRGQAIRALTTNPASTAAALHLPPVDWSRPDAVEDGFIRLGYDKLSGFKYDVYEVYSETNSGRAQLKSDDAIPSRVKAYDGQRVTVTGFVLPLRTKRGRVIEFLLLRDQGTCCFGPQAQINHFIRVRYPEGLQHDAPVPWKVSGTLRVGEIHVQGYLTGIYQMDATKAGEAEMKR
jgi:hypothetical protein